MSVSLSICVAPRVLEGDVAATHAADETSSKGLGYVWTPPSNIISKADFVYAQ